MSMAPTEGRRRGEGRTAAGLGLVAPLREGPRRVLSGLAVGAVCLGLVSTCRPAPVVSPAEVTAIRVTDLPREGNVRDWQRVPIHRAELLLQDLVEPRLLEPSTTSLNVQAVTDGLQIAFRLTWNDTVIDDRPGPGRFSDACAVQVVPTLGPDLPAPQMGEMDRPVEISYWSAFRQAIVDGRSEDIRELYPGAVVDHYPFDAPPLAPGSTEQEAASRRYAPARAAGNPVAGPWDDPVEDLVAAGPGSLRPASSQVSSGGGRHTGDGWEVVIVRPMPPASGDHHRSHLAFAVWQGGRGEVGARKMRTGWVPMVVRDSR